MLGDLVDADVLVRYALYGLSIVADATIKATLVLLAAILVAPLFKRASAAARHLLWLSALAACLLLPVMSVALPTLRLEIFPQAYSQTASDEADDIVADPAAGATVPAWHEVQVLPWLLEQRPSPEEMFGPPLGPDGSTDEALTDADTTGTTLPSWPAYAMGGWLLGLLLMAAWWLASLLSLARLCRSATSIGDSPGWRQLRVEAAERIGVVRPVELLQADRARMPMTFGILRPRIVVSAGAPAWSLDRRRVVLLHEMAHVRRWDCLWGAVVHVVVAVYWFHPLAWHARRQLRRDSELACDDLVLGSGPRPSDYAEHLLSIAQSLRCRSMAHTAAITMARSSGLEGRLRAILDAGRNRRAITRGAVLVTAAVSILLIAPLASVRLSRQSVAADTARGTASHDAPATQPAAERAEPVERTGARDGATLLPHEAVVRDPNVPWGASHWANVDDTQMASEEHLDGSVRFTVLEPEKRKVWVHYFTIPIDPTRYPILVLEYQASNTDPAHRSYVLWIDDETGPDRGGLRPFGHNQVIADGQRRELRTDVRTLNPKGNLTGFALGVYASKNVPATFDLLALRFEAAPDAAPREPLGEDPPLTVVVTNGRDGTPVRGAEVIVDAERLNFARRAVTDAAGRAVVTPLANGSGKHMVRVTKDGMSRVELADTSSTTAGPIQLGLWPTTRYSGRVVDEAGNGIEGAVLQFSGGGAVERVSGENRYRFSSTNARTDRNGRWQSPPMRTEAGQAVGITVHHREHPIVSETPDLRQLENGTAVTVLPRGLKVTGTVVSAEGAPVAKARVRSPQLGRSMSGLSLTTDAQGRFHIANASPGGLTVVVTAAGHGPQVAEINVPQGQVATEVRIQLTRPQTMRLRVVDQHGNPVAGAHVQAGAWRNAHSLDWSATTDKDGRATWPNAPADPVQMYVRAADYASSGIQLTAGMQEHVIKLMPALTISGTITDAASGQPIPEARIMMGIDWQRENQPTAWQDYRLTPVKDGKYKQTISESYPAIVLRAEADGYIPAVSRPFKNNEGNQTFDFKLKRGHGPRVFVRNAAGLPMADVEVHVVRSSTYFQITNGRVASGRSRSSLRTNAAGELVAPADPDPYALVIAHDDGYAMVAKEQLDPAKPIVLQPWARVTGKLMIGSRPGTGQTVAILQRNGAYDPKQPQVQHQNYVTVNDSGQFTFDRVPPGDITVARRIERALGGGRSSWTFSHGVAAKAEPGKTTQVTIGGKGRPVVGRVVVLGQAGAVDFASAHSSLTTAAKPPELPLPAHLNGADDQAKQAWFATWRQTPEGKAFLADIERHQAQRISYPLVINDDGTFRIDDVEPGTYRADIRLLREPAGVVATGTLELTVPEIPGGRSDAPLDVGTITCKPVNGSKPTR